MKIIFLTEANKLVGLGHLTRCLSLYREFKKRGYSPHMIVNYDQSASRFLKEISKKKLNWIKRKRYVLDKIDISDIIIIDSYNVSQKFCEEIAQRAKLAVFFDDTNRIIYPNGIIINSALNSKKIKYPKEEGRQYLLGQKYIFVKEEFLNSSYAVNKEISEIILSLGGILNEKKAFEIIKKIDISYPKLKKVFIANGNSELLSNLQKEKIIKLIVKPDANGMAKIMKESDLAISAGGQTVIELLKIGVPVICISLALNQKNHIKGFVDESLVSFAGSIDDKNLIDKIENEIERLKPYEERLKRSEKGKLMIDGKGQSRVADFILKKIS